MRRRLARLAPWAAVLLGAALCTLLGLLVWPRGSLLPFFFFAIIAALAAPLAPGALALLLSGLLSTALLLHRPPSLPPLAWPVVIQAEVWLLGTGTLVLLLAERLRRRARALARAHENVLPALAQPGPQHLYARLLNEAPDALVVVDSQGSIVFFSAQAVVLFGYERADILGHSVEELLPEELRARHVRHRAGYMANPHRRPMGMGLALQARRADGTLFPVEVALSPIETEQVGHRAIIVKAAVRDITARLAMEEALLEERVRRETAERAVAERDAFLSIAAHELKTPLTSLHGYSELLAETLAAIDTLAPQEPLPEAYQASRARMHQSAAALRRQSDKLAALIERLLEVARLGTGQLVLQCGDCDLVALAREVATAYNGVPAARVQGPAALWCVCDALRLEQVLSNLIDNARKYAADGGPPELHVMGSAGGAELRVCDRGPGIAPEERGRVFERFYQIERRGRAGGLGLGLYLSREIVQLHGGSIAITDNPGGGTCVTVTLPCSPVAMAAENDVREAGEETVDGR